MTNDVRLVSMLERAMNRAIEEAVAAAHDGNYPLGALVMDDRGDTVSVARSELVKVYDPTAHPEIVAIRAACAKRRSRYLEECVLVTTMEPCPMCTSAAIWAKMAGVGYGTRQPTAIEWYQSHNDETFTWRQISIRAADVAAAGNPVIYVVGGVLEAACNDLLDLTPVQ